MSFILSLYLEVNLILKLKDIFMPQNWPCKVAVPTNMLQCFAWSIFELKAMHLQSLYAAPEVLNIAESMY